MAEAAGINTPNKRMILLSSEEILKGPIAKCESVNGIQISQESRNVSRKNLPGCTGVTNRCGACSFIAAFFCYGPDICYPSERKNSPAYRRVFDCPLGQWV
jgi:hypothetical protein